MKSTKKLTTEIFINRANIIYDKKFDYTQVFYINSATKINIICKKHGLFKKTPNAHLNRKQGCPSCFEEIRGHNLFYNNDIFIEKANLKHNFFYNYSLTEYKRANKKVKIICPKHGIFNQLPNDHLRGRGCILCAGVNLMDNLTFTNNANLKHKNQYDYSLVEYKGNKEKVIIICKEHGKFKQMPNSHLLGQGCPTCGKKTLSEYKLYEFLKNQFTNYNIVNQGKPKWLGRQSFDIYFPDYNIAIEYQGGQHFKSVPFWGGDKQLVYIQNNDKRKLILSHNNNCKLLYFSYDKSYIPKNYEFEILDNEKFLVEKIKELIKHETIYNKI